MSTATYSAVFPGSFSSLKEIAKLVREAAKEMGLSRFDIYTVETAVDEACSNIIEHAYQGEDRGNIECICTIDEDRLIVVLKDQGKPFDPSLVPEPDTKSSLDERKSSGLGLYFMRQMMDEVEFDFDAQNGNKLTMVKYKER